MHTFIDLVFAADGTSPLEVSERLRSHAGLTFIVGDHDLVFEWTTEEEFRTRLGRLHEALRGTGVTYRVHTTVGASGFVPPASWPPSLDDGPQAHPGYARRP